MSELLRGKVHLNANDQSQLYKSKKKNLQADLHHNKNLNIFNGDGYNIREEQPYQYKSYDTESPGNDPSFDQYDQMKPALVPRKSPLKEKYGKLGSLYNPNNVDPRTI